MIDIQPAIREKCPALQLGVLRLEVSVQSEYPQLLDLITQECDALAARLNTASIAKIPAIAAARKGYKALGKDPARYRLSAEALLRRVVNGKGLYQINNVVDALNLVSIKTGISIGGYNFEKIDGAVQLDIGRANEPYDAIGRGDLNMEFIPLLRDQTGAFGSPTSDSTRTMVNSEMSNFLMVFFGFAGADGLDSAMDYAEMILGTFAGGRMMERSV